MDNTQTSVPHGYVYLAMTANFWGMAKSEQDALRNVRGAGGKGSLGKYGYVLYRCHPDTEISEVDGGMVHPRGSPPIRVADHRKD